MTSRTKLVLRLVGDLPPTEDLMRLLGVSPEREVRRGTPLIGLGGKAQDVDVWSAVLIERSEWVGADAPPEVVARAAATLRRALPGLAALDRVRVRVELYVSSIRDEESGRIFLSPEVVNIAGEGMMALVVSTLYAT